MKVKAISKYKVTPVALCVLAAINSTAIYAQDADQQNAEKEIERISVIGSNIKRATDIGALPVTTLTSEDIENTGAMTGDDLISLYSANR